MTARGVALMVLVLAACGSGPAVISMAEQSNGRCPVPASMLTGVRQPGDTCNSYADCLPKCCLCTTGTMAKSWLAAACINGICDMASACERTRNDVSYCN
jgi:hypothetical protein